MLLSRCNNVSQVYALRFFVGKNAEFGEYAHTLQVLTIAQQALQRVPFIPGYST